MKTKLQQILDRNQNGREIVIWGTPPHLLLRELGGRDFFIWDMPLHLEMRELDSPEFSDVGRRITPEKHYVVAVTEDDLEDFLLDERSRAFAHADDFICYADKGGELPFDWDCHGTPVGRQTYFGERIVRACENGYVKSIGRYTSINSSAAIHVDHQFNMMFVSDEVTRFFSDEHRARFNQKILEDPKLPYAPNKSRPLTIGSDVWIGANAFINCSKVTSIGDGAIIGAGAVVLENVPPYAVAVGVPAKLKRFRYAPEVVETLLRLKWWDWSEAELDANADALMSPEVFAERFMRAEGQTP